jgi:hypothetical protein
MIYCVLTEITGDDYGDNVYPSHHCYPTLDDAFMHHTPGVEYGGDDDHCWVLTTHAPFACNPVHTCEPPPNRW